MKLINILVAAVKFDLIAQGILNDTAGREGVRLLSSTLLKATEVRSKLAAFRVAKRCAVIFVGEMAALDQYAKQWLEEFPTLVVVRVELAADLVHIDVPKLRLEPLLSTICTLIAQQGALAPPRIAQVQLHADSQTVTSNDVASNQLPRDRPLLTAALRWISALMLQAVQNQHSAAGDFPGLTVTFETVQRTLAADAPLAASDKTNAAVDAEKSLMAALEETDPADEPLAALSEQLKLTSLEWQLLLLILAPELDIRYQKTIGYLLDDMGRRVGTLTLFAAMLGDATTVRNQIAATGGLLRWRLLAGDPGNVQTGDSPVRGDPAIAAWILGQPDALEYDGRIRALLRTDPWPGALLLRQPKDRAQALRLVAKLRETTQSAWTVLSGAELAGWRALLELGARIQQGNLLRCDLARVQTEPGEVEEAGIRLTRLARLTGEIVVLDAATTEPSPQSANSLRMLIAAMTALDQRSAIIASEPADIFPVIDSRAVTLMERAELDADTRRAMVAASASDLGLTLSDEEAAEIGAAFPLTIEGVDLASRLAFARTASGDTAQQRIDTLRSAYRSTASRAISRLATRIVPKFALDDVILPRAGRDQLDEIVANVRLASRVLDQWGFGEKLPYGRGVAVLFHGPSGTGKTMAAQGIAGELGIEIFALDLSRVVSKYIGDTEKNIDVVFADAQRSGAAVLINEADALFGKRSEVKDAHDRYANIEVAYLLQRMEDFEGLAILTTNIRQNLDPAFLRRLRFVIEFPRPDAAAREDIWKQCLPDPSHELSPAEIRLLARKVELTGGHIRQITLRAAFAAAAADSRIGMRHISQAINAELTKLGLPTMPLEPLGKAA